MRPALPALRAQPTDISVIDYRRGMANAFVTPPCDGAQYPFRGKERHLSVVGDGPAPAVSGGIVCDPRRSVFVADDLNAVELDRRAQSVARRASQETTGEMLKRSPAFKIIASGQRTRFGYGCVSLIFHFLPRSDGPGCAPRAIECSH